MSNEILIRLLAVTAVISVLALFALIYFSNARKGFDRMLLIVITAALPFLSYAEQSSTSGASASFFAVNICLADLFLPLAVLYLIIKKMADHSEIEIPLAWFFWFYCLWIAVSLYVGIHTYRLELLKISNLVSIIKTVVLVFYFWVIVNLIKTIEDLKLFSKVWIITGSLNAMLGIAGSFAFLLLGMETPLAGAFRAQGTLGNPNNFAGYMVSVFFAAFIYKGLGGKNIFAFLAMVLAAAGIFVSASKGALGAWLGGCFLLAVFIPKFRIKAIGGLIVALVIISTMYFASDSTRVFADRLLLSDKEDASYQSSLMSRVSLWLASLEIWQENIVFGIGKGNFGKVSAGAEQDEMMQETAKKRGLENVEIETTVSHSTYISLLSETGLVGFMLFIGMALYFVFRLLVGMVRLSPDLPKYFIRAALLCTILAILAQGLFANVEDSRYLWVILGASFVVFSKSDEWKWDFNGRA